MDALNSRLFSIARTLGLDSVLAVAALRVSEISPTAAWTWNETRKRPEIHVHPQQLRELPDNELQALLLHECMHLVLWNTKERIRCSDIHWTALNISLDVSLESFLSKSPYQRGLIALNDRLLLNSLPDTGPIDASQAIFLLIHSKIPPDIFDRIPREIQSAWRFLWLDSGFPTPEVCYQVIFPLARRCLSDEQSRYGDQIVILSPDGQSKETLFIRNIPESAEDKCRAVQEALSGIVRDLLQIPGSASWLQQRLVKPADVSRQSTKSLRKWLSDHATSNQIQHCLNQVLEGLFDSVNLPYVLQPTRREIARLGLTNGSPRFPRYQNKLRCLNAPFQVFLDVSGSMAPFYEILVGLVSAIADLVGTEVCVFDCEVRSIKTREALNGKIFTGAGTDYNSVARYLMANNLTEALVLTDGYSEICSELQQQLRSSCTRLRCVLFGNYDPMDQPWWYSVYIWK